MCFRARKAWFGSLGTSDFVILPSLSRRLATGLGGSSTHLVMAGITIHFMAHSSFGRAPWRAILIQLLILSGLVVFYKLYLPYHVRDLAGRAAAAREQKIMALFQGSVVEDSTHEISVPQEGVVVKRHPQRLRTLFSPREAESTLGVPDATTTDFRGGQHFTWLGTTHKLEASFIAGRLYCLTFEDRATGHGAMVFESIWSWHPY